MIYKSWMVLNILDKFYYHAFFNDTATTEIYTLSLHDALPISSFLFLNDTDFYHITE